MHRILIISQDFWLVNALKEGFEVKKYYINTSPQIETAYNLLEKRCFDLVITDDVWPNGDSGLELVSYIHQVAFTTKILVIAANNQPHIRISALEAGADDCLSRPLIFQEIFLHCCRLLQMHKRKLELPLQVGLMQLYPETGVLRLADRQCVLRRRECQILSCLVAHKNSVVTRETLVQYVWGTEALPTYTTVDVYIRRLRLVLGKPNLIQTVRGFGYRLYEKSLEAIPA